jgi:hypothetical protein
MESRSGTSTGATSGQAAGDPLPPEGPLDTAARAVRVLVTIALLAVVATYVAAQVDFLRRHHPGIMPARYWLPQLRTIWAPGLGLALISAAAAFAVHLWSRRRRD